MEFIRKNDIDIAQYLPNFILKDKDINNLLAVESEEHDRQRKILLDILNQFFISTATWGLRYWEEMFQIFSKDTDSYELRRARIYTKLQSKQISTVEFLTQLAKKYFVKDATVEIKEVNEKNLFYLIANYTALDNDYKSLVDAFEMYKPAHLAMIIQHYLDSIGGFAVGGIIQQANCIHVLQDGAENNFDGEFYKE